MESVLKAYEKMILIKAKRMCSKIEERIRTIELMEERFGIDMSEAKNILISLAISFKCMEGEEK